MSCNCCKRTRMFRPNLFDSHAAVRKLVQGHRQLVANVTEFLGTPDSEESRANLSALLTNHSTEVWGNEAISEVWGGKDIDVANDPYPECCAVGQVMGDYWFASGVRIHRRLVLTAAHVVLAKQRLPDWVVQVAFATANWDVRGETPRRAVFAKEHSEYVWVNQHDIGVIILAEDTPETPAFDLSRLATTAEINNPTNNKAVVVGYGANDPMGQRDSGVKRFSPSDLDITSMREYQFFAQSPSVDTCLGDSGGPAYMRVGDKLKLAGITSRGLAGPQECGPGGYYTRIDAHWGFIKDCAKGYGILDLPESL